MQSVQGQLPVVQGQPMPGQAVAMAMPLASASQQSMSVAATVPGGQAMTISVNGQQMAVLVPMGVQQGETFTFQVAAS